MKLRTGDRRFCNAVCGRKSPEERGFTHGCGEKGGWQNHRNSISRSGGDDPTFRESLRIRAQRLAAHTRLPPVGLPTHTNGLAVVHVHIIVWCLRRVNHFLRPWAAGPAWTEMMLEFSNYIRFSSFSAVCILSGRFFLPSWHAECNIFLDLFNMSIREEVHKKKKKTAAKADRVDYFVFIYLFYCQVSQLGTAQGLPLVYTATQMRVTKSWRAAIHGGHY